MSNIGFSDNSGTEKPNFDLNYCDSNEINSNWFKFDNELTNYLLGIVEEGTDKNGRFMLEDGVIFANTLYAILFYKMNGYVSPNELDVTIHKDRAYKLGKMAFEHAKELIDQSRISVAEKRWNLNRANEQKKRS